MVELPLHEGADMREETLLEYGNGLYFLSNGFRRFETSAGPNSWFMDHGVRVWLMDGSTAIARAQEAVSRAEVGAEVDRLVAQMTPWVPTIAALARADRLAADQARIIKFRDEISRDTPREQIDWLLDRYPGLLAADERKLWWVHELKIRNGLTMKAKAVHDEYLAAATEALDSITRGGTLSLLSTLPPTPDSWSVPFAPGDPWTGQLRETCARAWAAAGAQVEDSRGSLVQWALTAGMNRADLHQLTGMSRTTINRYVNEPS